MHVSVYIISKIIWEIINTICLICKLIIIIIIFYEVFKNYLIYIRNNVQHIYYFVSKKQKKYIAKVFKNYLLYKFEKKYIWCLICKLE